MKSILQLLYRIGNAMVAANVGNRFEFERLMRERREQDLVAAKTVGASRVAISRPTTRAAHRYLVANPGEAGKPIRQSVA